MTYPPQDYYDSPEQLRSDITLLFWFIVGVAVLSIYSFVHTVR